MLKVSKEQLQKETNQEAKDTLIASTIANESFSIDAALGDSDDSDILSPENYKSNGNRIVAESIPHISEEENQKRKENRKDMLASKTAEPVDFAYERAIGNNDSLYSNFIELIAITKRKVARIVIKENGKKTGFATGFMVSKNLMLTNWHVFKTKEMATESEAHFFFMSMTI